MMNFLEAFAYILRGYRETSHDAIESGNNKLQEQALKIRTFRGVSVGQGPI